MMQLTKHLSFTLIGLLILSMLVLIGGCKTEPVAPAPTSQTTPAPSPVPQALMDFFGAAQIGDTATVKSFLEKGMDVNAKGPQNNTAVMEAAYAGHLETVKLLLDHGADLSAKKIDGASAPTLTVQKDLVQLFADVSTLVDAAREGNNQVVKEQIAKGTPVNGLDRSGFTALTEASWNGRIETVKLLLQNGADPNIRKSDGGTPIGAALAQKHEDVAAVLKEAIEKQAKPAPASTTK